MNMNKFDDKNDFLGWSGGYNDYPGVWYGGPGGGNTVRPGRK